MRHAILVVLVAAVACGSEPGGRDERDRSRPDRMMHGPWLGFVFDRASRSLRPAFGLPGAVRIGASLPSNAEVIEAEISPKHDRAIALDTSGTVLLMNPGASAPTPLDVPPSPSRIVYSPNGGAAALLYPDAGEIRTIRFENAGSTSGIVSAAPAELTMLAISDDGTLLTATAGGAVYLDDSTGSRRVGDVRRASAATFLSNTEAIIADGSSDTVYLLRNGALVPIAGDAQGVAEPVAVSATDSNRRVLVANRRSGTILSIGLDDGVTALTECGCRPETLRRTLEAPVFWIADGLLFDAKHPNRVWFAPMREGEQR